MISWLLVGLIAGALAKLITPQKEDPSWLSSLIIGVVGSGVGGFLSRLIGLQATSFIGSLAVATAGAVLVLFLYHRYKDNANKG